MDNKWLFISSPDALVLYKYTYYYNIITNYYYNIIINNKEMAWIKVKLTRRIKFCIKWLKDESLKFSNLSIRLV